jgi:DeoR family transcriptional regulator of aga operon
MERIEFFWRESSANVTLNHGRYPKIGVAVNGENGDRRIPAERRGEIRRLLSRRGAASISEISAELGVSASTVRRDLDELDREGDVRRSHGGATTVERTAFEFRFEDRRRHNSSEKNRIGEYAAGLLEVGQSVIFDSSTTVLAAAEALGRRPVEITGVTNDVGTARVLAEVPSVNVVMPGGNIRDGSFTLLGAHTQVFLESLHADVALMGIHAISGDVLSESSLELVEAKRAMMRAARRVILLADRSKFRPPAFFEVARLDLVDDIITDGAIPSGALEAVSALDGLRVHLAES